VPELPDITIYIEAIEKRIGGTKLNDIRLRSPFLLRTADIPFDRILNKRVVGLRRIGKRIAIGFEDDYWMVFHLMIAGRFYWKNHTQKPPGKAALITLSFEKGVLYLTETGKQKRASLHLLQGEKSLSLQDPGGMVVDGLDLKAFSGLLTQSNHTVKRLLTDPHLFSGIGNAYSDEILHRARISPVKQSKNLSAEEIERLYRAAKEIPQEWTDRLRNQFGEKFPEKITAFHPEMAVHGKFGRPCPVCRTTVQRIRYAGSETNYCPRCQTDGKLLADRALSKLLKKDWPKTIEELENKKINP
jgi:formamidopyrimidine-DNA glycosylase